MTWGRVDLISNHCVMHIQKGNVRHAATGQWASNWLEVRIDVCRVVWEELLGRAVAAHKMLVRRLTGP